MLVKILTVLALCGALEFVEVYAGKRIKRHFDVMENDHRIQQNFTMLPNVKQDHSNVTKAKTQLDDLNKNSSARGPLIEVLGKVGHDSAESQNGIIKNRTAAMASASKYKTDEIRYKVNGNVLQHSKHHKNKHFPHSVGIFEAKLVLPSHHVKPALHSVASLGSVNLNKIMEYKVGIDSSASNLFYPRVLLAENSPSLFIEEVLNEPPFDYFFDSLRSPIRQNSYRPAFKQSNSPLTGNSWQSHDILIEPTASAKEPPQLANLMQNALDTLLGSSEDIEGDKSAQQIEFRCPIHQAKGKAQIEGDRADVIQVCSCRLIKKTKEEDGGMKKLK